MSLKSNLVNRVNSLSSPLSEALKASQELMAPQLDAGTKGYAAKDSRKPPADLKRLPHY